MKVIEPGRRERRPSAPEPARPDLGSGQLHEREVGEVVSKYCCSIGREKTAAKAAASQLGKDLRKGVVPRAVLLVFLNRGNCR